MRKGLFVFTLVGVLLLLAVPLTAQDEGPPRTGLFYISPNYAVRGPYWVGTTEVMVARPNPDCWALEGLAVTTSEDEQNQMLLSIWYPALNPEGLTPDARYDMIWKLPIPIPEGMDMTVAGQALRDAAFDMVSAPYPLVVFSPGYISDMAGFVYLAEHLASHGFVVIGADPDEVMDPEWIGIDRWKGSVQRPCDIRQTLNYAEGVTAPGEMMAGLIDMERVAVAGHSYGGWTALLAGGARYDFENHQKWCDTERAAGSLFAEDVCGTFISAEADMVAAAGLDAMPDGLWPSMGDPRVDAIVPMAGDAWLFGPDGLAEITVPMLAIGGTADYSTPFEWGTRLAYDYVSSAQKVLVGLENAGHMVFIASCDVAPPIITEIGACFDMVWDTDRIHDLINHFTTAFLLATLKGDAEAAFFLSQDAPQGVRATGVRYEAVGY